MSGFSTGIASGRTVERATALPPQGTTASIFRISGGKVRLTGIFGEVTTAIGAVANATKLIHDPSGAGANVDLCATVDINAFAVGKVLSIVGVLATAMKATTLWLVVPADNIPWPGLILAPGDIVLSCAGSSVTGSIKWTVNYEPVDAAGLLIAV